MKYILIILTLSTQIIRVNCQERDILKLIVDSLIYKDITSKRYYLYELKIPNYNIKPQNEKYFKEELQHQINDSLINDLINRVYYSRENYIESKWTCKDFSDAIILNDKKTHKHFEKYFLTIYVNSRFDKKHYNIQYIDTIAKEIITDTIRVNYLRRIKLNKELNIDLPKKKYRKHPIPKFKRRIFWISNIIFNDERNIALVDWGYNLYMKEGYGCTLIFVKRNNNWIFLGKYLVWES